MGNDYLRIVKFYTIKDTKTRTKIQAKDVKIDQIYRDVL